MQSENRFFDDLSKVATGAAGTFAGMAREFEATARERFREWVGGLDMVTREEFEAVKAMAVGARAEVEALKAEMAGRTSFDDAPTPEAARGGAGVDGDPQL